MISNEDLWEIYRQMREPAHGDVWMSKIGFENAMEHFRKEVSQTLLEALSEYFGESQLQRALAESFDKGHL